ncbi:GNAT family N-acetyltransferase [Paenibacillus sp. FSL H8-0548]|uniref:GNAT family N-acetyltransferase n=1 Tax=Paenibacillus sp. FSL H8-0548 TaxID=1920422 RepID=UPI00096EDDC5|nr:GNAT family N-acetyltransferase [Paenibacillus sp. FSL H8-0548]OMF36850.1 GNAT family N-acetyltransferase [Paenibacillus sp. FSL H8-0548]
MEDATMNPLLLDIPESFESQRLIIRSPLWGDGAHLNEAVKASIKELKPWMPWAEQIPTVDESEAVVRRARLKFLERSDFMLLLILKETGQLIGSSGLHRIDWQSRKFEIGYWIHSAFSGNGYISEAVDAISNFAVQELKANRVEIRCDSRNIKSAGVAQRLGFTLEGILRYEKCAVDGSLRDTMIFSKIRGKEL